MKDSFCFEVVTRCKVCRSISFALRSYANQSGFPSGSGSGFILADTQFEFKIQHLA